MSVTCEFIRSDQLLHLEAFKDKNTVECKYKVYKDWEL